MRLSWKLSLITAWSLIWPLSAVRAIDDSCAPAHKNDKYDYIVVGSGPGGGPLAARLAIAGFSVLLLEAGGDHSDDLTVEIPLLQTQASEYIPQSWQFFVSHYSNDTQALLDSKFTWRQPNGTLWVGPNPPSGSTPLGIYYPRAGTLGGCAEHNALVAMYPQDSDWNFIANLTGDHSWDAANMRKYWERMENNQYIPEGTPAASGHGYGGWLNISVPDINLVPEDPKWISLTDGAASVLGRGFLPSKDPVTGATLEKVLTLDVNNDLPNHDTATGIYQLPLSVSLADRSRSSPRDFIVHTSKARHPDGSKKYKLDIQLNTFVTRVIFDNSSTPRATGVEYTTGCNLYSASPSSTTATITGKGVYSASREVILAGGTYNTPQLLKLSGIGTRAELGPFKIPVIHESPGVGTNMQDRYEVSVVGMAPDNFAILHNCTFLHNPVLDNNLPEPEEDPCLFQWQNDAQNRGIYGTNGVAFGIVHQTSVSEKTEADMFIVGYPANFHGYFPGYSMAADLEHWSWLVLKAHSRNNAGTVTLKSANPFDMPQIDFHSFARGGDLDAEAVYEGIELARQMFAQSPDLNGTFTEVIPGPQIQTRAEVVQWLRDEAWGHHASCSVPIGALSDPNAPLDSKFRVKGVDGLRVVDASAFPRIPGFYVAGAIFMISEKAADVIIEDAKAGLHPRTGVVYILKAWGLSVWEAPPSTLLIYAIATLSFYHFVFYRLRR